MRSQKTRILELLKQRPVKNYEFFRMQPPILRASERIKELKADGYYITCKRMKKGIFEYRLETEETMQEIREEKDRETLKDIKKELQLEL